MGLSPGDQGSPGEDQVNCGQREESEKTYLGAEPRRHPPFLGKEVWGRVRVQAPEPCSLCLSLRRGVASLCLGFLFCERGVLIIGYQVNKCTCKR